MSSRWKTYWFWFLWISVAFVAVYPTCNWITSRRGELLQLYLEAELAIPFVPAFAWPYLSLYAVFFVPPFLLESDVMSRLGKALVAVTLLGGVVFLLLPAELGFERVVPTDPLYAALFERLFLVDHPHNLVPSLHVAFSGLILFTLMHYVESLMAKALFGAWLVLLCVSTVFVHQHHLLDIATGLLVAVAAYRVITQRGRHD